MSLRVVHYIADDLRQMEEKPGALCYFALVGFVFLEQYLARHAEFEERYGS